MDPLNTFGHKRIELLRFVVYISEHHMTVRVESDGGEFHVELVSDNIHQFDSLEQRHRVLSTEYLLSVVVPALLFLQQNLQ